MNLVGSLDRFWRGQACEFKSRSKQVRVFLSSAFAHLIEERRYVADVVYPELVDFFLKEYGLEFQVSKLVHNQIGKFGLSYIINNDQIVDMQWKSADATVNKTKARTILLNEIKNCRNDSIGPFFVVIHN